MKEPQTVEEGIGILKMVFKSPVGQEMWDLVTGLRGPDFPSERADDTSQPAYKARVARKMETVAVIRGISGLKGGSCRHRNDVNYVTLPPPSQWDHFDKHVARAAAVIGVSIRVKEKK